MARHAQIFFFLFGFPLYCLIIKHLSLARKVAPPLTRGLEQRLSVRNRTVDASNTHTSAPPTWHQNRNETSYLEKELLKAVDSSA